MFSFHELSTVNYTGTKTVSDCSSRVIASSLRMFKYFSAEPRGTGRVTEGSYVQAVINDPGARLQCMKVF